MVEHHLAKVGVAGSNPVVRFGAGVAELADAQDLKSCDRLDRTGSIPVLGKWAPLAQLDRVPDYESGG